MSLSCGAGWILCLAALLCLRDVSSVTGSGIPTTGLRKIIKEALTEALKEIPASHQAVAGCRSCPSSFIPCGGGCYSRLNRAVEYEQAELDCDSIEAHLAVPRSRAENLCVAGLAGNEHIWLGITDREREGYFRGADGRLITANDGHRWARFQPDNAHGQEHCVEIQKPSGDFMFAEWNDERCSGVKRFPMCQPK